MPNWCGNKLVVSGPGHEQMVSLWSEDKVFSRIVPEPENFSDEELAELDAHWQPTSLPMHAITNDGAWYWWRLEHWGTKWDTGDDVRVTEGDQETVVRFDTAWTPPKEVLYALSAQYPDLRFKLFYSDPNMPFAGEMTLVAGRIRGESYYEEDEDIDRVCVELWGAGEEDGTDDRGHDEFVTALGRRLW